MRINVDLYLYDNWNRVKKSIQSKDYVRYFREREIWWCNIGQNLGMECYGKGKTFTRPVLIYRKLSGDIFLGLPLTSQTKCGTWYTTIAHKGKKAAVLLSQARIYDKKRLVFRLGEAGDADYRKIKAGFASLYCPKKIFTSPCKGRGSVGESQK